MAQVARAAPGELLEQCLDACREFGRRRGFILRTLGFSMLLNMISVFQFLAVARGLGLNISPVALFVMVPMITCVSALPITPSGLGVRENLYVLMLAAPEIQVLDNVTDIADNTGYAYFNSTTTGVAVSKTFTVGAGGNSPAGVRMMQLYIDGKKAFDLWNDQLKRSVTVGAGRHRVSVIAIDRYGATTTKTINVTAQ